MLACNTLFHGWEDAWPAVLAGLSILPVGVRAMWAWIRGLYGKTETRNEEGQGCTEGCQEATSVTP